MDREVIVAVTGGVYRKAPDVFEAAGKSGFRCVPAPADEAGLSEAVRTLGARHVIVGVTPYERELYETLPRGGVIARFGVGFDSLDFARATANGVLCVNTPGALDDSVAEYTIALVLSAARHLMTLNDDIHRGIWEPRVGMELRGKRLTVVGCGHIGNRVARIASAGLGMEVRGCEIRHIDFRAVSREYGFTAIVRDFAEAVDGADFVSLHIPFNPATRRFINAARLAVMPASSWLINTARGAVVDESALHDALSDGVIAGAALDVFEEEPYVPVDDDRDLRRLPNVIMTPHTSSSTREACERIADRNLRNIMLAERGEYENMDLLNPEVLINEK